MAGADAVVIGGGAAGIAAPRVLHDAGRDVLLIEAKDRLGGRAHSVPLPMEGGVVDAGCGWLHSAERNPWVAFAERYGFPVDRSDPGWGRQWRDLGFAPDDQRGFGDASDRLDRAAHSVLAGPDRALGGLVPADEPWRPLLDAISGYVNGARLDAVSLHDWAAYEDASSDNNWALPQGYGTLVVRHGAGVPVQLGTRASCVDHRGRTIRVDTDRGTIETRHVIVAVPTTILASGTLRFDPLLPAK